MNDDAVLATYGTPTDGGRAGGGQLALGMEDRLHADRREQRRGAGIGGAQHVVERSRSETSRSIRGTIRRRRNASRFAAHRVLGAGAAEEVAARLGRERLPRGLLELGPADGVAGRSPAMPRR